MLKGAHAHVHLAARGQADFLLREVKKSKVKPSESGQVPIEFTDTCSGISPCGSIVYEKW